MTRSVVRNVRGTLSLTEEYPAPKPAVQKPGEIAAAEAKRRDRRDELKELIAGAKHAEATWNQLKKSVSKVSQNRFDALEPHREKLEPLKTELVKIGEQIDAIIADLGQPDPALAARATELRGLIKEAGSEEKEITTPYDRKLEQLEAECFEAKKKTGYCHYQFELIALGRPDLLTAMRITLNKRAAAEARVLTAKKNREACKPGDKEMIAFWDTEVAAMESECTEAAAAHERSLQAVYDE